MVCICHQLLHLHLPPFTPADGQLLCLDSRLDSPAVAPSGVPFFVHSSCPAPRSQLYKASTQDGKLAPVSRQSDAIPTHPDSSVTLGRHAHGHLCKAALHSVPVRQPAQLHPPTQGCQIRDVATQTGNQRTTALARVVRWQQSQQSQTRPTADRRQLVITQQQHAHEARGERDVQTPSKLGVDHLGRWPPAGRQLRGPSTVGETWDMSAMTRPVGVLCRAVMDIPSGASTDHHSLL
ncbi:hypothetical protein C8Q70DRAFT_323728 [Cubamyces menziesii]|nr:hypothetical protein C8Q70DRAFT_323728 [Cubamyces menziesii]